VGLNAPAKPHQDHLVSTCWGELRQRRKAEQLGLVVVPADSMHHAARVRDAWLVASASAVSLTAGAKCFESTRAHCSQQLLLTS
jgi:hypothetical protein